MRKPPPNRGCSRAQIGEISTLNSKFHHASNWLWLAALPIVTRHLGTGPFATTSLSITSTLPTIAINQIKVLLSPNSSSCPENHLPRQQDLAATISRSVSPYRDRDDNDVRNKTITCRFLALFWTELGIRKIFEVPPPMEWLCGRKTWIK